jgi:hypothetical protein
LHGPALTRNRIRDDALSQHLPAGDNSVAGFLDEAVMIAACLDSVPFAAEKLVIDCGSTHGT